MSKKAFSVISHAKHPFLEPEPSRPSDNKPDKTLVIDSDKTQDNIPRKYLNDPYDHLLMSLTTSQLIISTTYLVISQTNSLKLISFTLGSIFTNRTF